MKGLTCVITLFLSTAVLADKPRFGDTFTFSAGGMNHYGSADFSSTNTGDEESIVDFDDLGLSDNQSVFWGGARWRFTDRWEAGISYTSFNASGTETADHDWNFGDLEVTTSATVFSDFDLDLLIVDVTWDFLLTEKSHMGVGLGLHIMDTSLALDGELDPGFGGDPIELGSESGSTTVPLPNITLMGGHRFTDTLYLGAKVGYFSLDYDKYDGELTSARALLEWRPFENFGFGLGYQYVDIDLKVDTSTSDDRYNMVFDGPLLVLSLGF